MRLTNVPGGLINSSNGRPASTGMQPCWTARPVRPCESPNNRHFGEPCPLVVLIMPLCLPLFLTMRFRKWLRRRVGQKSGNVIGKIASASTMYTEATNCAFPFASKITSSCLHNSGMTV
jgi:hypothetical protein